MILAADTISCDRNTQAFYNTCSAFYCELILYTYTIYYIQLFSEAYIDTL